MKISNSSYGNLIVGLLALSRLACARIPHHRHHRRHAQTASTVVGGIPTGIAAVVDGPPDNAVVSVAPPPDNAVVASVVSEVVSEVVASVVDAIETVSVDIRVGMTIDIAYTIEPSPTKVPETSCYEVSGGIGMPVATGVSTLTSFANATATSTTIGVISTTLSSPAIVSTAISNYTAVAPVITSISSIDTKTVSSVYPTISATNSTILNSTITSSVYASVTASTTLNITSTITSGVTTSAAKSSTKSKPKASRTWTTLNAPTSISTFTRASSTVNSLPAITNIPTTPCSSLLLSFNMPTWSSRKATPTSIIDLSTFPANVSANAPCYDENCSNPDSGMNYKTTISAHVDLNNTMFTGDAPGRDGGLAVAAAVAGALWGFVLLL